MEKIKTELRLTIPLPALKAYDFWMGADLSVFFTGHRFVPGILGAYPQHDWNRPGRIRTIYFGDATTASETLLVAVPGFVVRSCISGFDSFFGWLIKEIHFECVFTGDIEGMTKLSAEFTFIPKNRLSAYLFKLLMLKAVVKYLQNAFRRLQQALCLF